MVVSVYFNIRLYLVTEHSVNFANTRSPLQPGTGTVPFTLGITAIKEKPQIQQDADQHGRSKKKDSLPQTVLSYHSGNTTALKPFRAIHHLPRNDSRHYASNQHNTLYSDLTKNGRKRNSPRTINEIVAKFASKSDAYLHRFTKYTLVPNSSVCSQATFIICFINSKASHVENREAIRQTWGDGGHLENWERSAAKLNKVAFVFVLAKGRDKSLDAVVLDESLKYGDILQGDFTDAYRNLTAKSVMALRYASEKCTHVPYFLKTDDDVFIHVPRLMRLLKTVQKKDLLMGPSTFGAKVQRLGKWRLSRAEYLPSTFPPYMAGSAYVIGMSLIPQIYDASFRVPAIFIDDVYITGILVRAVNATISSNFTELFSFATSKFPKYCDIVRSDKIAFVHFTPLQLRTVWRFLLTKSCECLNGSITDGQQNCWI